MKFALVTLHVQDMEKSLQFYNGLLGMPIVRKQPMGPGKELVFLGLEGAPNLELVPSDEAVAYAGFSIGFEVEDLPGVKDRLAQNGYPVEQEMQAGVATLCFFKGPNGEDVELVKYHEHA